eukprot:m.225906 g.225906  ORF g.225906 m.225906 type:complete len:580 (-) comp16824_c0_seq1:71-1810(-)
MVSSVLHVLRGQVDIVTCVAAVCVSILLLRLYSRKLSLLWVALAIQPVLWIPDSTTWLTQQWWSNYAIFAIISATVVVLLPFGKPPRPSYDVDKEAVAAAETKSVSRKITKDNLGDVVDDLRAFYRAGLSKPLETRKQQLLGLRRFFVENEAAIIEALKSDLGRPLFEGLYYDVLLPVSEIDHAIKNLHKWTAPKPVGFSIVTWPSTQWLQEEPYGVVLIMSCWNFPINLALLPAIGAIAAGNSILIKPNSSSPACARLLRDVLPKYVDPRLLAVAGPFECTDIECSQLLLKHRFDHIFFTGSVRGGAAVMAAAAQYVTPCVMELGGKNPVFIDRDVDLDLAAKRIVWGRMTNGGQVCICPDYVLCDEAVIDQFCELTKKWTREFYGSDPKTNGTFGRINATQMARMSKLLANPGGTVVVGGTTDPAANFVEPTVVLAGPQSPLMQEELFGPILVVNKVKNVDEALAIVNARDKPLAMYIFSNSEAYQRKVVSNTSAGGVTINGTLFHAGHPGLPFGGVGTSGFGAYHGKHTFDCYSHKKPVLAKSVWRDGGLLSDPFFLYPPWDASKIKILRLIAKIM